MKPEYKLRQEMYHKLNPITDDIKQFSPEFRVPTGDGLVHEILAYFSVPVVKVLYPSKSYAVAVIYAKKLREYFGGRVIGYLKDPELLFGNDKYFTPYMVGGSADIYNRVLLHPINWKLPQVIATTHYFKEEFYLNPNPYFDNSILINKNN